MRVVVNFLILAVITSVAFRLNSTGQAALAKNDSVIPTIEYCSLLSVPETYDGKKIRVRGVYLVAGTHISKFFSTSCQVEKNLWVEFSPDFQSCSQAKDVRLLEEMTQKSGFRWTRPHVSVVTVEFKSAAVEFVGTFSSRNPFRPIANNSDDGPLGPVYTDRERADFVFTVSCIEKLKGLPRNAAN